jgi:hypothetical protein
MIKPLVTIPGLEPAEYEFLLMCFELQSQCHLDQLREDPKTWELAAPIFREASDINLLSRKLGSSVQYNQDGTYAEPLSK